MSAIYTRTTSVEAYQKLVTGSILSPRRAEVYHLLYHCGPLTANELKLEMKKNESPDLTIESAHKRLTELRDMGLVRELSPRLCRVSGQNCIEWDVTASTNPKTIEREAAVDPFELGKEYGLGLSRGVIERYRHLIPYADWLDLKRDLDKLRGKDDQGQNLPATT